ncbi:uncharacterized protein LOC116300822 [Actinia tenebrosa]|uniref:Insulin receptor substrate 1 n=1 Tax=Actinia tenebrosa TaxID=6105 RepID=A0A6P8IG30_ACTTE|nr:uncharacterized protein LOC116300822 [Actinia tenebrosa]
MNTTDVRKQGFLRRLKTLKRRYFVLRTSSKYGKTRLEYYESEKKFRSNAPPKRTIHLTSCFNIARKDDTKHKFVFALYTREDAFGLICETEEDLDCWLNALLTEKKNSESVTENEYSPNDGGLVKSFSSSSMKREYYSPASHVSSWPVTVKPRGLGTSKNLAGSYLLQLANHHLSLVKTPSEELAADFRLMNVRRCGHTDCFFYMEVGRSCSTGAGELWMQVDDPILAQHLHEVILLAMQNLSGESSSLSRYRCHSGGHKQRPTSLMLLSPTRSRSDTDTSLHNQSSDGPVSPSKHTEQYSPAHTKPSAMFQRLLSVGKRKTEDLSPRLFSRRTQSKSLSIDPCQGGLLDRAQSVDFSRLFSGADLQTPETPESPEKEKEIIFDMDVEPVRTSSNSSGSSARSWDQSHSYMNLVLHRMEGRDTTDEGYDSTRGGDTTPKDATTPTDNKPLHVIAPSNGESSENSRPPEDDRAQDDSEKPKLDDRTVKKDEEEEDNIHRGFNSVTDSGDGNSNEADAEQVGISPKSRSRYEDMSFNFKNLNMKGEQDDEDGNSDESETLTHLFENLTMPAQYSPKQRRTSEPVVNNSSQSQPKAVFSVDQVTSETKSSSKQRRTSEPATPSKYELRELVQIRNSPSSSPRRSKKGVSSLASTINGSIAENPDSESDSPSNSRRRRNANGSSADTSDDYVVMSLQAGSHTYVNMTPREGGPKPSEDGPTYMNFRPGETSNLSEKNTEEHSYMNFKPGDIPEESEAKAQPPSYINVIPGSLTRSESVSPRPKRKHAYENLNLNGTLKVSELESHDYMNFSPLGTAEDKGVPKTKSIPSSPRGSFGSSLSPTSGWARRIQRRESEPIPGSLLSDEETGMLFLDFSKKSKEEKELNYVSLDHSKIKKRSGGKGMTKTRPASINTLPSQKRSWDTGPKSASLEAGYAEIDFAKSQGLRQVILEHEKSKPQKE